MNDISTIKKTKVLNSVLPKTSRGYFFERNKAPNNSKTSVLSTRYSVGNSHAEIKTLVHPYWALDYTYGNCGFCRVGKRRNSWFARPAGRIHLYAPKTQYWEDSSPVPLPLLSSYMTFYGGEELDLEKHVNNGDGFGRFIDETGKVGELLAEAAVEAAQGGDKSYWRVMSMFYEIIYLLHSSQPIGDGTEKVIGNTNNDEVRSREVIFAENVRKYLQEHADENVSIADLAGHLNASVSTISHKYRELTGESPMKTLTTFRINAVKNLLAKGESIKFIAAHTGFCDEFHLSKVFKKVTGLSPSVYLRHLQMR
ncbi:MAG: AraC family transcriptional regulator [Lentisphaerae bacterium]|nr:AraC family transcriptional regulator [Lentisphaerota bacterium]